MDDRGHSHPPSLPEGASRSGGCLHDYYRVIEKGTRITQMACCWFELVVEKALRFGSFYIEDTTALPRLPIEEA